MMRPSHLIAGIVGAILMGWWLSASPSGALTWQARWFGEIVTAFAFGWGWEYATRLLPVLKGFLSRQRGH